MIKFTTSLGDFSITLNSELAPATSANFKQYAQEGHFDGLIFHRVIPGFMVQGGGYDSDFNERETRAPIKNEADNGLKNKRGTLSMARTQDPDSATSQFFINVTDNDFLDHTAPNMQGWGYAVFGEVTEGMEIVDQIVAQPTGSKGFHQDVPLENITILKAEVLDQA